MLTIKNFSCGYGNKFTIDKISFAAHQGALTGVIGPNGSGKTTLFRGIATELPPKTGNIYIDENDVRTMPVKQRAQTLAVVAQETEKLPISVLDYALMGRLPYKAPFQFFETRHDYDVVTKYLQLTGVHHLRDKLLSQLSGGERQLVSIARALAQEPSLLLLDEPTSNLDISHEMDILNLIQRLDHELELTVLIILHDLNLASEFCDHIVMMKAGAVFTEGTPAQVLTYENIETVYGAVVITKTNPLSQRPAIFPVSQKLLKSQPKGRI